MKTEEYIKRFLQGDSPRNGPNNLYTREGPHCRILLKTVDETKREVLFIKLDNDVVVKNWSTFSFFNGRVNFEGAIRESGKSTVTIKFKFNKIGEELLNSGLVDVKNDSLLIEFGNKPVLIEPYEPIYTTTHLYVHGNPPVTEKRKSLILKTLSSRVENIVEAKKQICQNNFDDTHILGNLVIKDMGPDFKIDCSNIIKLLKQGDFKEVKKAIENFSFDSSYKLFDCRIEEDLVIDGSNYIGGKIDRSYGYKNNPLDRMVLNNYYQVIGNRGEIQ